MRHLADSRYSNMGNEGFEKCMIERSGRCVKELEILRHSQTWSCLYKAWSCSQSREEPAEIRTVGAWEGIRWGCVGTNSPHPQTVGGSLRF